MVSLMKRKRNACTTWPNSKSRSSRTFATATDWNSTLRRIPTSKIPSSQKTTTLTTVCVIQNCLESSPIQILQPIPHQRARWLTGRRAWSWATRHLNRCPVASVVSKLSPSSTGLRTMWTRAATTWQKFSERTYGTILFSIFWCRTRTMGIITAATTVWVVQAKWTKLVQKRSKIVSEIQFIIIQSIHILKWNLFFRKRIRRHLNLDKFYLFILRVDCFDVILVLIFQIFTLLILNYYSKWNF